MRVPHTMPAPTAQAVTLHQLCAIYGLQLPASTLSFHQCTAATHFVALADSMSPQHSHDPFSRTQTMPRDRAIAWFESTGRALLMRHAEAETLKAEAEIRRAQRAKKAWGDVLATLEHATPDDAYVPPTEQVMGPTVLLDE